MGFFDRFFKNKKKIEEEVEKALEDGNSEKKSEKQTEINTDVASDKQEIDNGIGNDGIPKEVRIAAKQYLPGDVLSIQNVLPMVRELVVNFGFDMSVCDEAKEFVNKAKNKEAGVFECMASSANMINSKLEDYDINELAEKVKMGELDTLLKTWVVLDFFVSLLKAESSKNLRKVRDLLTDSIDGKKLVEKETEEYAEFVKAEKECKEIQEKKQDDQDSKQKLNAFFDKLLLRNALFVLYDADYNEAFPYISYDGKIEICSRLEIALNLKKHYEENSGGHTYVKRIDNSEFDKIFRAVCHLGVKVARMDNGTFPVDIFLKERFSTMQINLIERFNGTMRSLFLRCKQYEKRFENVRAAVKDTPKEKAMLEAVLTMRFNGYRELANSLVYVFIPKKYDKTNTLYTPAALEKARRLCTAAKLGETSLVAPGNHGYTVYDGKLNIRVTHKGEDGSMENSKVCVFTSMLEAEKTRRKFAEMGCHDSILAISFEELEKHIEECSGIIVDLMSYAYEIRKVEYPMIKKWRDVKGRIVVNLKKKNEDSIAEEKNGTEDEKE